MKEFLLIKKSTPTIGSSYDTLEVFPETQCDPKDIRAEKILGHIRCVPKADFDAIKKELEGYRSGDLPTWKSEYEDYKAVSESLDIANQKLIAENIKVVPASELEKARNKIVELERENKKMVDFMGSIESKIDHITSKLMGLSR